MQIPLIPGPMSLGGFAVRTADAQAERRAFTAAEVGFILASPVAPQVAALYAAALPETPVGDVRAGIRQCLREAGIVLPGTPRRGEWIQTFRGTQFHPLDPRPEDIHIEDIAHSLSMQCRYAGHSLKFYSVAEHCVLLSLAVEPVHALAALLHDGEEAYLPDMVRPTKRSFPEYVKYGDTLRRMIFTKYGLAPEIPDAVHKADDRICADEKAQNMAPCQWKHNPPPLGVNLRFWGPEEAEQAFLQRFEELTERP